MCYNPPSFGPIQSKPRTGQTVTRLLNTASRRRAQQMSGSQHSTRRAPRKRRPTLKNLPCDHCGSLCSPRPDRGRRRYFCSLECHNEHQRLPLPDRFWPNVQKSEGCWEWQGVRLHHGYGALQFRGKLRKAHRLSWELHNGPIPEGLIVCHHCDNPPCVRPDHLFLGTSKDNADDKGCKGRQRAGIGERNGSARLTEGDVLRAVVLRFAGWTYSRIGDHLGVTMSSAHRICVGQAWSSVTGLAPSRPRTRRPRLARCRCGGTGQIRTGLYDTWREIHCDSCGRIAFGRDEESAVARWNER